MQLPNDWDDNSDGSIHADFQRQSEKSLTVKHAPKAALWRQQSLEPE